MENLQQLADEAAALHSVSTEIETLMARLRALTPGRQVDLAIERLEEARFRVKEAGRETGGRIHAAKGPYDDE